VPLGVTDIVLSADGLLVRCVCDEEKVLDPLNVIEAVSEGLRLDVAVTDIVFSFETESVTLRGSDGVIDIVRSPEELFVFVAVPAPTPAKTQSVCNTSTTCTFIPVRRKYEKIGLHRKYDEKQARGGYNNSSSSSLGRGRRGT